MEQLVNVNEVEQLVDVDVLGHGLKNVPSFLLNNWGPRRGSGRSRR